MLQAIPNRVDIERILGAIARLEQTAHYQVKVFLPRTFAEVYRTGVVSNIVNQRFVRPFKAYDERYAKWKSKVRSAKGFWHLFGDFIKNFQVFEKNNGYFSGIPAGIMDRGGTSWLKKPGAAGHEKPIAMYGYVMEWGGDYGRGGKHPGRPVLGPTLDRLAISAKASELLKTALQTIGSRWK